MMNVLYYNQFQGIYEVNDTYYVIDFLKNEISKYKIDEYSPVFQYSEEYQRNSNAIDKKLAKCQKETLYITVITDFVCNMKCCYCYEQMISPNTGKIDVSQLVHFIQKMRKEKQFTRVSVNILGGEPQMAHNLTYLDELFKQVRALPMASSFSMVTNGLNIIDYLDHIRKWKLDNAQVTLDGTEEVHNLRRVPCAKINGFLKITEGISKLLEMGTFVSLRVNVDRNNVYVLSDLGEFILQQNWISPNFQPYIYPVTKSGCSEYLALDTEEEIFKLVLTHISNARKEIRNLFILDFHGIDYLTSILKGEMPQIRPFFCGVSEQFVISNDGGIYSCWWGINEKPFKIGEIENDNSCLDQQAIFSFKRRSTTQIPRCKECKYKYLCGGGCAYTEWYRHKSIDQGNCANFNDLFISFLKYYEENK